jgi:hypothetical protein
VSTSPGRVKRVGVCQVRRKRKRLGRMPKNLEGKKRNCRKCGLLKESSEFKGRYSWDCNTCRDASEVSLAAYGKKYRNLKTNKYRHWERNLLKKYNLTVLGYQKLLDKQGGGCATCNSKRPGMGKIRFCVDHDHSCCSKAGSCGKCIRGLLCSYCNVKLGYYEKSKDFFHLALPKYLKGFKNAGNSKGP